MKTEKTGSAGSRVCTRGVECFTLAWTAGLLSAFLQLGSFAVIFGAALIVLCALSLLLRELAGKYRTGMLCIGTGLICASMLWQGYDALHRQPLLMLGGEKVTCTGTVTDAQPMSGDRVTLRADLEAIASDYRFHTAETAEGRGEYLRCYSARVEKIDADTGFSLRRTLHDYRSRITALINEKCDEQPAALLRAMLFGDKSVLDESVRLSLYRTGIGHITAVSGLHLVFLCTLLTFLLRRLHAGPRMLLLVNAAAVLLFSVMVDSAVSVWRGTVMILLYYSAPLFGRKTDTLRSLCIAMLLCTAFTPYVIGSVSFWLSVSGVFGVGIAAPYMTKKLRGPRLKRRFLQLCCVAAAVFPASLLLTGESSLLSPAGNLLILPLGVGAVYIGLLTLCTGGLTAFLLPLAGLLCRGVIALSELLAGLPFSHVGAATAPVRAALVVCTLTVLLLFAMKTAPRHIALTVVLSALLLMGMRFADLRLARKRMELAVLGTSSDSAIVICAENRTIVADLSGGRKTPAYVKRFLSDRAISQVDTLLLTNTENAAKYQSELKHVKISSVRIETGTPWRDDLTLFDQTPEFASGEPIASGNGDFSLLMTDHSVLMLYAGYAVDVLPAESPAAEAHYVIRWGKGELPWEERRGLQLSTARNGENFLLTLTKDGKFRLDDLEK